LDCQNYKTRAYILNVASHTIYLDILYANAVDIPKFFKGIGLAQEVSRTATNSTVCRLIMGDSEQYKAIFFDVNKSREIPNNIDVMQEVELAKVDPNAVNQLQNNETVLTPTTSAKGGWFSSSKPISSGVPKKSMISIGGLVSEDERMTKQAFDTLIQQMIPLQGNLCPQKGKMVDPFNDKKMPNLSCPSKVFGGKQSKKRKQFKKRKQSKKRIQSKKRNTRRIRK